MKLEFSRQIFENAFETRCWRRMVKIKWTDRITNDIVFQRAKEERLLLKNRRHSRIGHTIRHNEFVVNILEGAISGKKAVGRPRLQYSKQVARNTAADSYTAMKRMACNDSRWKAAKQSKYCRIRRDDNITFNENPSNGRRIVPCGRTNRRTKMTNLIVAFLNFATRLKQA